METMNIQTTAVVAPKHALGLNAPSRLREVKRAGYISAFATPTGLGGYRLAPDSAPGNPPA